VSALVRVLDSALSFYSLLIFAYVILSWFVRSGGSTLYEIYRVLGTVVVPYIGLFRRIVPAARTGAGGIDFSPLVALLVLEYVIRRVLLWQVLAALLG